MIKKEEITTYKIKNIIREENNVIVFVAFEQNKRLYEETLRLELNTNINEIFSLMKKRAEYYDEKKIEEERQAQELRSQLLGTSNTIEEHEEQR
jgi:hypothetical protein